MKKEKLSWEEQKRQEEESRRVCAANNARLSAIIKPLRSSTYAVDYDWLYIARALEGYSKDYGGLELNPDFQRGHVWTKAQQVHYIENALRGIVAQSAFVVQFNCPNWDNDEYKGDLPRGFQCIDGLQRLTAVRKFLDGEVKPFGLTPVDLNCSSFSVKSKFRFKFEVFDFQTKADLLRHYLDLNAGGTPHSQQEIERVKAMLESVRQ